MANNKAAVKDLISIELPVHIGFIRTAMADGQGKGVFPENLDIGRR